MIHFNRRSANDDPIIGPDQRDQRGRRTIAHFLVAVNVPLFACLLVAKMFACGTSQGWSVRIPLKLACLTFHDLEFVLGWTVLSAVLLFLARRPRTLELWVRGAVIAASCLIVLFGIINIWVYCELRMPLTFPMLITAKNSAEVRLAVSSHIHVAFVAACIAGPVIYLALVCGMLRARWAGRRFVQVAVSIVVVIYWPMSVLGYVWWFATGPDEALAKNPHWAFITSSVEHWRDDDAKLTLGGDGPPSYGDDFLTQGDRPVRESPVPMSNAPRLPGIKNVVLVVLESTSTRYMEVYGSEYPTTPCLKAEAGNAMILSNFYSNSGYTLHALMPLVLSLYSGTGREVYPVSNPHLAGEPAAQILHERGYRTAFMTGGRLDLSESRPFLEHRGFDVVWGYEDFQKMGIGTTVSLWGMDDPPLFDSAMKWIGQDTSKPFFMTVWTQQTHHPYAMPPYQHAREFLAGPSSDISQSLNLYLNDIHFVDEQLGRLFAFLRQKNLANNTLVIITGDHGEAFGSPHFCVLHGTALYQESVNVPCILWSPALFPHGRRSAVIGAHVDLAPTIFDLLDLPPSPKWQGTSLFDLSRAPRAYFTCNTGNLLLGLRDGSWKFIYNQTLSREELYDLASDPTEQNNLAKTQPQRCLEYRQRLSAWGEFERRHFAVLTAQHSARP